MADSSFYLKKIRRLSQALFVSGILNIGVLALFSYWVVYERPPTPYFELKPATSAQQQRPLADNRGASEVIRGLKGLTFGQLVSKLNSSVLVENGYTERDLALASLVGFQYFDLERALPEQKQTRQLSFKGRNGEEKVLTVYPGLTDQQYNVISRFAKTEQWPLTAEGLFLLLQKQKKTQNIDPSLAEAFILTPEFSTLELLFSRNGTGVRKQRLLEIMLEGNWASLRQFVDQQRQLNDLSAARRQKFLLDYIKLGSETAAYLLLETELEFATKKLDDAQVIAILQLLSAKTVESERFAISMLTSPRSTSVLQQASLRLYEYAGESIPKDWNYESSLSRFAPDKLPPAPPVVVPKPVVVAKPVAKGPVIAQAAPQKPSPQKPATAKPNKKPAEACRLYIVQEGDSLWKISRRFGVDMEVLKKKNRLQSNSIKPGTVLKIP